MKSGSRTLAPTPARCSRVEELREIRTQERRRDASLGDELGKQVIGDPLLPRLDSRQVRLGDADLAGQNLLRKRGFLSVSIGADWMH